MSRNSRHKADEAKSNPANEVQGNADNEQKRTRKSKRTFYFRRRFPILLRVIIITAALVISLGLGLMVGYGVIGDGEPKDVLKKETWQHILDIVEKE